ncbi:uncharacterized protein N0V89_011804 [Didymosphaeria variabile]|uniref:Uncharacterized protein n=1 Tax=Didymosphaeria variabile TaxID=1932322 RepID=A0A9W8XAV8_9PLEO|nr:uncharacterized protein N0V89_011804 [Didymosphaeria variabile]KAJ4345669.1 hypothetical protein N0V89_011804 [Didymosphaeria variabile]
MASGSVLERAPSDLVASPTSVVDVEPADHLAKLVAMLASDDFVEYIAEETTETALTEAQKQRLRRLANHLAPSADRRVGGGAGRNRGSSNGARNKRQKSAQEAEGAGEADKNPWKRIMDMTSFPIEKSLQQKAEEFKQNPGTVMKFFTPKEGNEYPKDVWANENVLVTDAFVTSLQFTQRLIGDMEENHTFWLFQMLLWHRFRELFAPGKGSGATFSMGAKQEAQLRGITQSISEQCDHYISFDVQQTTENIRDWAKLGMKLDILVSQFGPGCFFVLGKHLTENFLRKRITQSGLTHDLAISHLKSLHLEELLKEAGLDTYGHAIIDYLVRPFQKFKEDQAMASNVEAD